ncbi:hypothetical protein CIHG_06226 [Coccidioides immitis H538.4]|uniref:Uncharacterized protein n=3 Tax=Coccidioides immitis TaxID=5501 RepID=A0A0J8QVF4_COCIT|nr:hypothetical protein CIRG_09504 [Coccidioides immitis RMSCC 2394]KMU75273.1 hypothetical protein CISG_04692 [Coccidioides immitis RMSCC 3703]KMU88426.1 hypothetical protein CIHG_06226 [Coccidioides immitis H538.4]
MLNALEMNTFQLPTYHPASMEPTTKEAPIKGDPERAADQLDPPKPPQKHKQKLEEVMAHIPSLKSRCWEEFHMYYEGMESYLTRLAENKVSYITLYLRLPKTTPMNQLYYVYNIH